MTPTVWSTVMMSLSNVGRMVLQCVGKVEKKQAGNTHTDSTFSKFQTRTLAGHLSHWSALTGMIWGKHTHMHVHLVQKASHIVLHPWLHPWRGLHKYVEHVKGHHHSRALLHAFRITFDHFLDIPVPQKNETRGKKKHTMNVNCQWPISCSFLLFDFSTPPMRVGQTRERRKVGGEGIVPLINVIDFGDGGPPPCAWPP